MHADDDCVYAWYPRCWQDPETGLVHLTTFLDDHGFLWSEPCCGARGIEIDDLQPPCRLAAPITCLACRAVFAMTSWVRVTGTYQDDKYFLIHRVMYNKAWQHYYTYCGLYLASWGQLVRPMPRAITCLPCLAHASTDALGLRGKHDVSTAP